MKHHFINKYIIFDISTRMITRALCGRASIRPCEFNLATIVAAAAATAAIAAVAAADDDGRRLLRQ
jgi:hypothetical protein